MLGLGGPAETVRILVVEDFCPFRRLICGMLRKNPDFQVVDEVSDGKEAVRRAEELRPDLILLDIGLPTISGIEAAQQIREVSPESRIIFVSLESSVELVRAALSLASGYVAKRAVSELLTAIEVVRRGEEFVSSVLAMPSSVLKPTAKLVS